jgi:uncharacterized Tic20 family protein
MKNQSTAEEKLWAVISYLSVFLSGTGLLMPAFAWVEHRKKSKYIAFHALQAFAYQSLGYTLWALLALLVLTILTIATLPLLKADEGINLWVTSHVLVTFGLYGLYLLIPIIGAVLCVLGRDFSYPILGRRVARYIGYDPAAEDDSPLDETNQERVAASMAHFAIVYPLWGMLPSLIFLLLPGGRSRYLKFQSLQTIIFQAVSTLVTFALGGLAFVILFASVLPVIVSLQSNTPLDMPPMESIAGFFVFLICLMVVVLVVPLYQILGQWAGLRILQGHDYRYPLIGRWVERWLAKRKVAVEQER